MKKKYTMYIHTLILTIISITLFTIYTISNNTLDTKTSNTIYIIGMSLYGLFILLNFYLHKNSFYGVSSFCMTFLFCEKGFSDINNISLLSNLFMLTILGLIIHLIKYKPKIHSNHFTISSLLFILAIALSGIGVKEYDPQFPVYFNSYIPLLIIGLGTVIIIILNYFSSTNESTLEDVSTYFKAFIILIGYEIFFFIFYKLNGNFNDYFYNFKDINNTNRLNLGIGHPNTIAIILQMTIPFMLYFSFKNHKIINTIFYYLNFLLIIMTMSRGVLLVTTILMVPYTIYLLIKNRTTSKINLICHLSIFIIIIGILIIIFINEYNTVMTFLKSLFSNLSHLNGRERIWKYVLEHYKINPIFGIGILSNSYWRLELWDGFQFAHSTILQTLWMAGIVGLIGLFIHLFDKYYYIIKNKKYVSLMLMFYLCSGLYGTFDVTYYNLHFTTYLLVIMFLYSSYIYKLDKNNLVKEYFLL